LVTDNCLLPTAYWLLKRGGGDMLWIMYHPAMHHGGCMAALNLTWFGAKGTI